MRPIEKTSSDLFQKLRSRYNPVTLGNDKAEATSDPEAARFFNFIYTEHGESKGTVSISLVDGRSMKVFYGDKMTESVLDKAKWYGFLKELRNFAKRNLLTFDARDIAKGQLDSRDLSWLGNAEGILDKKDVTVIEGAMWGSKRRSYQTLESVKLIVQHNKTVDENKPGARSRSIKGIYLERSDGERYHFPFNYLTGARAMARHICEGGTPYDPMGQHVLGMIREMRDLSKFARMTRTHALEDSAANETRQKVIERYQGLKSSLSALAGQSAYKEYIEQFKPTREEAAQGNLDELRERFTRKIWDQTMEELLPAVNRAITISQLNEAPATVEKQIKDPKRLLILKNDPAADQMLRRAKFTDSQGLMGFVLSDIATRAIGDDMDALANFAADVAERIGDRELDQNDKKLAMLLVKRYIDDIKKMMSDPDYANDIRKDPRDVYGAKRKRAGGFHEAEAFEAWANEVAEGSVTEKDDSMSAVANAIIRSIMLQHPELITKHGPDRIMQAADSVADFIGDVEEIGSSDVSTYVKYTMDELGEITAQESSELAELQALSGTTRVDPRDPKSMTKAALGKLGITTGEDPKTGALTVSKSANKQQVQAALKTIAAKTKGKVNPTVVMQGMENDAEPVMEKELKIKNDQDGDGDEDFADIMVARRIKSGEPRNKAIAATKDKPYNEADVNEDKLMSDSLSLLRTLAGI